MMDESTKKAIVDFFSRNPMLFVIALVFVLVIYLDQRSDEERDMQERRIDRITDQVHKAQIEDTANTRELITMFERVLKNQDDQSAKERAIAAAIETMRRNQQVLSARVTRMESRVYPHPATPP